MITDGVRTITKYVRLCHHRGQPHLSPLLLLSALTYQSYSIFDREAESNTRLIQITLKVKELTCEKNEIIEEESM